MDVVEMSRPSQVVLLACGSFNPPTIMHMRMFEIARDYLRRMGKHTVVGGILSPVHDDYGKKELVSGEHRRQMLGLALGTSDWLHVSQWETRQSCWQRTRQVLNYHQFEIDRMLEEAKEIGLATKQHRKSASVRMKKFPFAWLLDSVALAADGNGFEPVKVKLLCGADLLESFHIPGLWADEDVDEIVGGFGLVVITRHGSDAPLAIYKSDLLTKHEANIDIVTEWVTGDISSTKIRCCLKRGESIKYLVPDSVINYIRANDLFTASSGTGGVSGGTGSSMGGGSSRPVSSGVSSRDGDGETTPRALASPPADDGAETETDQQSTSQAPSSPKPVEGQRKQGSSTKRGPLSSSTASDVAQVPMKLRRREQLRRKPRTAVQAVAK